MALQFTVVKRKDMRKDAAADSKQFYGQTKASLKVDFDKFCDSVASYCTASSADVKAVLDAMTHTLVTRLSEGCVVQLQHLGNFQMLAGSQGSDTELDFTTDMFKRAKIVFRPGAKLRDIINNAKFEKQVVKTVTVTVAEPCDKEHVI